MAATNPVPNIDVPTIWKTKPVVEFFSIVFKVDLVSKSSLVLVTDAVLDFVGLRVVVFLLRETGVNTSLPLLCLHLTSFFKTFLRNVCPKSCWKWMPAVLVGLYTIVFFVFRLKLLDKLFLDFLLDLYSERRYCLQLSSHSWSFIQCEHLFHNNDSDNASKKKYVFSLLDGVGLNGKKTEVWKFYFENIWQGLK